MTTMLLRGRRITVVGLGKSGLAAVELCLARGALVRVVDQKPEAELPAAELRARGVTVVAGGFPSLSEGADALVVSPGVPLATPELQRAREAGVPVFGEIELAWREGRGERRCVAITGTNGKSTTTALTGELFRQTGERVFVGGNLGRPWSEAALDLEPYAAHVIELSSFQLEGIDRARFQGAAILNLTPDHLDRYPSHAAYGAAKARIFENQAEGDFAVVNADDAGVLELAERARVPVYGFGATGQAARASPALAGRAVAEEGGFRLDLGGRERFLLRNAALRGEHNRMNAMAAALLARLSGVTAAEVQAGLDAFPGLPHRLELVRTLDGVEWINDSKATNVDSAVVALRALPGRLWLIAGGKGKGAPYAPMVEAAKGRLAGVLTIGQDAPAIAAAFQGVAPVHPCGTLDVAVRRARELARKGEAVLLSPACASYDQFRNFEERGDVFKRCVTELGPEARGEVSGSAG